MKILVLGSAAGGGYPQWNCQCAVCTLFWQADHRVMRRTQSSVAISARPEEWVLLNCSPDIREQIGNNPALWPTGAPRGTPIVSIILTNGDIDHVAGLFSLRENAPLKIFGTAEILATLRSNPMMAVLNSSLVSFHTISHHVPFTPVQGLTVMPFQVPGKVPLYLEGEAPLANGRSDTTLGLRIVGERAESFVCIPGCASIDADLISDIAASDVLLFDGTLWEDHEMILSATGLKTGRRMGHNPVSGAEGSMVGLASAAVARRIFVHLNNTNPLLIDGSPARNEAASMGWEVAFDGMEIEL